MKFRRWKKRLLLIASGIAVVLLSFYLLQRFWAHRSDAFASGTETVCAPLLGWFTREDRRVSPWPPLTDVQPGDILLTLSTHTAGWRHGHTGLVINENTVLECAMLGTDSALTGIDHWRSYSSYAVLRLKDITPDKGLVRL